MTTFPSYSIAIRTLGTHGDFFKRELESIVRQTVQPEKVVVYFAEGGTIPEKKIGKEEYVAMPKGMVAQRAHSYIGISSEYLLLLDDDVELQPDSAERLLTAAVEHNSDCVGADTYQNQLMSWKEKWFAALTNLVFPRPADEWAFKIYRNGSFSYNNNPKKGGYYPTQYCAGPAMLWKREVLLSLHLEDERWLDHLGFSYSDDTLETYKLFCNGYRLGLLYDAGCDNLDGQVASRQFRSTARRYYVRSKASLLIWHRAHYALKTNGAGDKILDVLAYSLKAIWLLLVNIVAGIVLLNLRIPYYYIKGIADGLGYIHSEPYRSLPNYIVR